MRPVAEMRFGSSSVTDVVAGVSETYIPEVLLDPVDNVTVASSICPRHRVTPVIDALL